MTGEMNQQRFKALLKETITLLCSNGLNFKSEFTIEGVIGITIDRESIVLLSIQDTVTNSAKSISAPQTKSTPQSLSNPELLQADCVEDEYTASPSGKLKPTTDTNFPRSDRNDKHFGEGAIEIAPVLRDGDDFESTLFDKCADGSNIKLEQTEENFEIKPEDCLPLTGESIPEKPSFALGEVSLSCEQVKSIDRLYGTSFSNGERRTFRQVEGIDVSEEDFSGVSSFSWAMVEKSTVNNFVNRNRTEQAYTVEETAGAKTGVGHPDSEIAAVSSIDQILTSAIALPRVRSRRRRSNVLPSNSQDMQHATGRSRKKSALSPYQCKICGKRIGTLHSLAVHEAAVHLGKYRYSCPNCGKGYTVLSNLRAHIACKHNKQKEFVCGFCSKEYGYKHSLKEHILLVHNGNSTFS